MVMTTTPNPPRRVETAIIRPRWKRIRREIAGLDPAVDSERITRLVLASLLPPVGSRMVLEVVFTVSLMRVMGQFEGAAAVDRQGHGKVHRHGDQRAADTIGHLVSWMTDGAGSARTQSATAEVKRIHDGIGQRYQMSNETLVHTIAYFTVQIEYITAIVGAPGFTEIEREAQVRHWRTIGEHLGVRDMPTSWQGMEDAVRAYERDPEWFGASEAAHRAGEAILQQFGVRAFPSVLRWLARPLVLSLHDDHVLDALGLSKPAPAVVSSLRAAVRATFFLIREVLPDPRIQPSAAVRTESSR
ncbi:oxygenase MpaB family protein [Nocardia sp. NPDC056952]|uniref:oxygenase MpaB family protein n=1 Tax=Nocardia sp. NPDC056952 TaxID=3345979 RepID=UPI0036336774